ncbi:MAG: aldehyde:ferredoxin oxidoreductase [Gaiellales bacterium]|jgi:aldehyde:ferredoxin oxidoreductase|nr:aldehyde:ferredoxin oxidoreductase [Gaiellales bacterium]
MSGIGGGFGRYLRVDLDTGTAEGMPIPDAVRRGFIGGAGLGAWILTTAEPEGDPIAFVFSPLVGTPLTTSAKFAVVARSPLTGLLNDALASSHFAIQGKMTGHDAIVLTGRAAEPSVVVIDDGATWLEPAGDLMGLAAGDAEEHLRARLGRGFRAAAIGPAGERLVPFATVSHDGRHAGRGGHGAVLGLKNVKAIAVRGRTPVPLADPKRVLEIAADLRTRSFGPATEKYRELGTLANLLAFNALNTLPTRNFQAATFEGAAALSAEQASELKQRTRHSCASCTIGCGHIYETADGNGARLEYENAFALGPLCGVGDPAAVVEASRLCDTLGIDTISAGGTIAFAMECVERGLLDAPWLRFGSGEALLRALGEIGSGEGIGPLLRMGSRRLAEHLGGDAISFAAQVKGLELPGYEPRTLQSMALGLAVNARGADHNRSGAYEADFSQRVDRLHGGTDSVVAAIDTEDNAALIDSMILCKFLRGVFTDARIEWATLLNAVTGCDYDAEELGQVAGRIVTTKKLFNVSHGWTPDQDTLPDRFLDEPLQTGAGTTVTLPRERLAGMVREYNLRRGWDEQGFPLVEAKDLVPA